MTTKSRFARAFRGIIAVAILGSIWVAGSAPIYQGW